MKGTGVRATAKAIAKHELSKVGARVAPFVGRKVAVRTTWRADAPLGGELLALELLGSAYFVHVRDERGRSKFVNVIAVLEIDEVDELTVGPTTADASAEAAS